MSLSAIASGLFAIAKAIPQVMSILDAILKEYIDYKLSQITKNIDSTQAQRTAILKSIKKAETDEERIALSKVLYDFNTRSFMSK